MLSIKEVPFYPQKWDLNDWASLGFKDFQEAEYWQRSSCGVLTLKMAVDYFRKAQDRPLSSPLIEYIKKGQELGAYTDELGWNHAGLVKLAKLFGMQAFNETQVSLDRLRELLEQGYLVIFSLKVGFVNKKSLRERIIFWKKRGGHLALALAYEEQNSQPGFIVHHTSIREPLNWRAKFIDLKTFKQGFVGNVIAVRVS